MPDMAQDRSEYSSVIKTESFSSEYQKWEGAMHRPVNSYPNNSSIELESTRREHWFNNDTINSNLYRRNIQGFDNVLHEVSPSRYVSFSLY